MNAKQSIPIPVIAGVLVVVLGVAMFFGFRSMSGPKLEAPTAPQMYDAVTKMAIKSGGDYSKLSAKDQQYLELMSHGHGQKLLQNQYARATAPGGK